MNTFPYKYETMTHFLLIKSNQTIEADQWHIYIISNTAPTPSASE